MSAKKGIEGRKGRATKRAPARRTRLKLSDPRNVEHLYALLTDPEQSVEAYNEPHEWLLELTTAAGAQYQHPRIFPLAVRIAAEHVETTRKPGYCARQAYDKLAEIVRRTRAGETLFEVVGQDEAERERREEERRVAFLNSPEPKDKTSDRWRYWKLGHFRQAFDNRVEDSEAYHAAWREFFDMLDAFRADEGQHHITVALTLPRARPSLFGRPEYSGIIIPVVLRPRPNKTQPPEVNP